MLDVAGRAGGIAYEVHGRSGPALLCLPGWAVNRTFFAPLVERLSATHRVITLDWRGHGDSALAPGELGHEELVEDAMSVIDAAGLDQFVPLAQAHGGWIALELRRRLGARVPALVAMSWLVLEPPPPFLAVLAALQDHTRWQSARDGLFDMWTKGASADLGERVRRDMGAYGFATWSSAARAIAREYGQHGHPLRAVELLEDPPRMLHLFSQPTAPEFLATQEQYSRTHPWFDVRRLEASSHFPALEHPELTASVIERFIANAINGAGGAARGARSR
jgi:pimeloyl-ACP methyl ester carboxylesterase